MPARRRSAIRDSIWCARRRPPASRSSPCPDPAPRSPRCRSRRCRRTASASRDSCRRAPSRAAPRLETLAAESRTLVFYESPHRVRDDARRLRRALRPARAARRSRARSPSCTKRPTAARCRELARRARRGGGPGARRDRARGCGSGAGASAGEAARTHGGAWTGCLRALLAELPLKQAARLAAQITGARDNEAYKRALQLNENPPRICERMVRAGVGQTVAVCASTWRKVRAPQGKVPGNAWGARAHGKCNRKIPPKCRASGAGKGEMVR